MQFVDFVDKVNPFSKSKMVTADKTIQIVIDGNASYDFKSVEEMYNDCPYLRAVLDYRTSCILNARFRMFQKVEKGEDKEIFNSPILALINKPNPLQSGQTLFAQTALYENLYGNSYIRGVKGLYNGFENSKALWSLPPDRVRTIFKDFNALNIYDKFQLADIIKYYEFSQPAGVEKLYDDTVLWNSDYSLSFDTGSNIKSTSKSDFETLKKSVANLMYIQESRGVIIRNRGALGMISQASGNKDVAGVIPLGKNDKTEILKQYKALYGLKNGQSSVIIPNVAMTWQSMILPIKDLMLDEGALHEFNVICDMFQIPRGIFDDKTAYNNQEGIKRKLYQDNVIPWVETKLASLSAKMGLNDTYIKADFSHISCLQEDLKTKEEVEKTKTDRLNSMYDRNLISKGTYLTEMGYEVPDQTFFKIYKKDETATTV